MSDPEEWWRAYDPAARRALRELTALRPVLDRLEGRLVDEARLLGCSWAEVGADLGLTKAGAYARHAGHDAAAARRRALMAAWDADGWRHEGRPPSFGLDE